MTSQKSVEDSIRDTLINLVENNWNQTEQFILMSKIGVLLKRAVPSYQDHIKDGIKEYLRLNPIVKVVSHPNIPEKIGLAPLSANLSGNVEEYFNKKNSPKTYNNPIYQQVFWDAFINKIPDRRFIYIDTSGDVVSIDSHSEPNDTQSYEILKSDLSIEDKFDDGSDKIERLHSKISDWLTRNKLTAQPFLKQKKYVPTINSKNLFLIRDLIQTLSTEEQSRIYIPLDILIKLIGKN